MAGRRRNLLVVLGGLLGVLALAWLAFAWSAGAQEVRRSLVDPARLPWPAQTVGGRITAAQEWDSELPSVELTVVGDDGRTRVLILNDSTTASGDAISSMPVLVGKHVSAQAKVLVPWPSPEYFVQAIAVAP